MGNCVCLLFVLFFVRVVYSGCVFASVCVRERKSICGCVLVCS